MLKQLTLAMGLVAAMATTSSATSVYGTDVTGANLGPDITRSGSTAIDGTGTYANLSVKWTITNPSVGSWHYDYTFASNVTSPTFSHFILEVSANATASDFSNMTVVGNPGSTFLLGLYKPAANQSNPGLPADIYGFKITPGSATSSIHLTFDSDRAPVWGNFYTKGNNTNYAWNTGLDPAHDNSDGSTAYFIARPDGTSGAVPEPSSIALLGCGALGLVGYGRRRKASRA